MPPPSSSFAAIRALSRNRDLHLRSLTRSSRAAFQSQPYIAPFTSRFLRNNSTSTTSPTPKTSPLTLSSQTTSTTHHKPRAPRPEYELTFTCKPCSTRSTHRVSKQGYHHGSVLITCPECRNRHVISDHLGIFLDKNITIEDLMREQGQLVKRGTLSEDGDLEFWADGTQTERVQPDAGATPNKGEI